ncbi:MarR family transcriptional regulator [Hydrocarboniphaga sp.]|uniref:MarR family winged helix-turn-helix transcriptional regulator n=1 Tax=Hydrocarboniphaga sp. TaxID=2033016 RepID=UPI0026178DC1|nr:MarR family transcriptional regulator [Hydrocarboniphaga sp.]
MKPPTDRRLFFLLNVGQRRVNRWIESRFGAEGGASAAQAGALFYLAKHDGALIGEIAEALDLAPSAMTGLADRMCKAGLAERRRDEQDGRAMRLHLSDTGRDKLQTARRGLESINAKISEGFSEAEMEVVARWLASLQTKFSNDDRGRIP